MVCRECGGLLHVGLGPHVCLEMSPARRARRMEQASQFETVQDALADLSMDVPRAPIRIVATVGRAIACQVGGCEIHSGSLAA